MGFTVQEVIELYSTRGQKQYGREAVSQLEHGLQCAQLAEEQSEPTALIVAALLHDFGHLVATAKDNLAQPVQVRDDLHQFAALPFLRGLFDNAVLEPIRLHVDAKRFLCSHDPSYWESLSPASKRSLELQGGIFSVSQAAAFIAQPYAGDAVRLRRYDDLAKVSQLETRTLAHYESMMSAMASGRVVGS